MGEPPTFDSSDKARRHFLRKYPKGTPFEVIIGAEPCEAADGMLTLTFPAPNHVASRHYRDADGNHRSMGVPQRWSIEFHFDDNLALTSIDAMLVSAPHRS